MRKKTEKYYTPRELIAATGLSRELYNQWLYRGLFTASVPAEGAGTSGKYSLKDIFKVNAMKELFMLGIPLPHSAKYVDAIIKKALPENLDIEYTQCFPVVYLYPGFVVCTGKPELATCITFYPGPILNAIIDALEK